MMSQETSERRMKNQMTSNDESFHRSWWAPVGMVLDLCPHCLSASTAETHMPGPKRPSEASVHDWRRTDRPSSINQSFLILSVSFRIMVSWVLLMILILKGFAGVVLFMAPVMLHLYEYLRLSKYLSIHSR